MSPTCLTVRCPAKVNLALRVIDRRPDGFHELDTVFQTIDLWDRLEGTPADSVTLTCSDPSLPTDERNLVIRAAKRLRQTLDLPERLGARLHLEKAIPAEGGLGGGSSDAAGAIMLLQRLWEVRLPREARHQLAVTLGADVPFFLTGGTARGRGRGDRIEPLPPLARWAIVLGLPAFGVPTAEVFGGVRDRLTLPGNGVSLPRLFAHKWPGEKDFWFAGNDLERVVFPRYPALREFRDALLAEGARAALLSGSGSTVFGVFASGGGLPLVVGRLAKRFPEWRVVLTRTVDARADVQTGTVGNG